MESASRVKYYNNTVFVFVGDHGLHGDAGNMFPESFTKTSLLSQHVPLLFYCPLLLAPARIHNVCSQLDILPSVATIAHQPYRNTTFGRNLFDSTDTKPKYAIIADADNKIVGLVSNEYYYSRQLETGHEEFLSVTGNNPPPKDAATNSVRNYMKALSGAWYQTAKWLLLNNKKDTEITKSTIVFFIRCVF